MDIKDFAAYGGLSLGLVNIGITLYKEFGKKGKLEILEADFTLRNVDRSLYDFQLDIRFRAKNENVFIKEIFLENRQCFTGNVIDDRRSINLNIPLDYKKILLRNIKPDNFEAKVKQVIQETDTTMTDFKIEKESNKSISYIDRLTKPRETDGWEEFPRDGWMLRISFNKTEITKSLTPSNI